MEELIKELKAQNKLLARVLANIELKEFFPSHEKERLARINNDTDEIILWSYKQVSELSKKGGPKNTI